MADDNVSGEAYLYPVVAKVLDSFNLVINKGSIHGIKEGDRFLIYELTENILDPITKESLGPLELSKGTGDAVEVFDNKTIIRSDRFRSIAASFEASGNKYLSDIEPEKYLLPFKNPKERDIAKPI